MSEYFEGLCAAMKKLSDHPKSIFVGQGVGCAGTTLTDTLRDVPADKLLEFPVAEDLQMGFCTGLALDGMLPLCIFPRWNFMICAANQIINHLDRLPIYSNGGYNPKVLIRVAVPATEKFDPGPQHDDDFTEAFRRMLRKITIYKLYKPELIAECYDRALKAEGSSILVEWTELYGAIPTGVPSRESEKV